MRNVNPHGITSASKRPKSTGGMDAETAAELARIRSRSIHERDLLSLAKKRTSFNDRGGRPGKNLRPMSIAATTPPLPSLANGSGVNHRQSWASQTVHSQMQEPDNWSPRFYQRYNDRTTEQEGIDWFGGEHWEWPPRNQEQAGHHFSEDHRSDYNAPEPDRRESWRADHVEIDFDPRESWLVIDEENNFGHKYDNYQSHENIGSRHEWQTVSRPHGWNQNAAEEDAPLPPPHSPRPRSISPSEDQEHDKWAAYGKSWQARRQSAHEAPRHPNHPRPLERVEPLYPEIPPRHPFSGPMYSKGNNHGHPLNTYINHSTGRVQSNCQHPLKPPSHSRSRSESHSGSHPGSYGGSLAAGLQRPHDPPLVGPRPQFG